LVSQEKEFQERIQKIGSLVRDLETIADPAARAAAKDLVQLLMDLHGAGLERALDIVFQSVEPGPAVIEQMGRDPLVGSLLILYGLHPRDFRSRVEEKLDEARPRLFKMGVEITAVNVNENNVRLSAKFDGHACGSTKRAAQSAIEDAVYEAAPDLASLVIEGLEAPAASGFIAIGDLVGTAQTGSS
jgi:Fe-S cluster biogenesis protein NfuA